jgi:hypothetical protein
MSSNALMRILAGHPPRIRKRRDDDFGPPATACPPCYGHFPMTHPSGALGRSASFWVSAGVVSHTLWTSAAPAVTYPLYAAEWNLSFAVTTAIFSIYPITVVTVLIYSGMFPTTSAAAKRCYSDWPLRLSASCCISEPIVELAGRTKFDHGGGRRTSGESDTDPHPYAAREQPRHTRRDGKLARGLSDRDRRLGDSLQLIFPRWPDARQCRGAGPSPCGLTVCILSCRLLRAGCGRTPSGAGGKLGPSPGDSFGNGGGSR